MVRHAARLGPFAFDHPLASHVVCRETPNGSREILGQIFGCTTDGNRIPIAAGRPIGECRPLRQLFHRRRLGLKSTAQLNRQWNVHCRNRELRWKSRRLPAGHTHRSRWIVGGQSLASYRPCAFLFAEPARCRSSCHLLFRRQGGSAGQSYQLLLYQDGSTYATPRVHKSDGLTFWAAIPGLDSLGAAQFTRIDGTGPAHPDLSASGSTIYFGYLTSNPVPQTCDMYGCSPNPSPVTYDTGIDNLIVTISGVEPAGVTCTMTPVNHFIPFHIPALHISKPDIFPNHTLKVLVTSNGTAASGVSVTMNASQTALSLTAQAPPTLAVESVTTGDDGNALFYHNAPVTSAYTRTDFVATGALSGTMFSGRSIVITGVGTLTDPILNFFDTSASTSISSDRPESQLFRLRAALLQDRKLTDELEQKLEYRSLIPKVLQLKPLSWNARDIRGLLKLLEVLQHKSDPRTRTVLAGMEDSLRDWIGNRHSRRRTAEKTRVGSTITHQPRAEDGTRQAASGIRRSDGPPGYRKIASCFRTQPGPVRRTCQISGARSPSKEDPNRIPGRGEAGARRSWWIGSPPSHR